MLDGRATPCSRLCPSLVDFGVPTLVLARLRILLAECHVHDLSVSGHAVYRRNGPGRFVRCTSGKWTRLSSEKSVGIGLFGSERFRSVSCLLRVLQLKAT